MFAGDQNNSMTHKRQAETRHAKYANYFHLQICDKMKLIKHIPIDSKTMPIYLDEIEKQLVNAFSPCEVFIHHDPTSAVNKSTFSNQ